MALPSPTVFWFLWIYSQVPVGMRGFGPEIAEGVYVFLPPEGWRVT